MFDVEDLWARCVRVRRYLPTAHTGLCHTWSSIADSSETSVGGWVPKICYDRYHGDILLLNSVGPFSSRAVVGFHQALGEIRPM